jgi:hypothetical protein
MRLKLWRRSLPLRLQDVEKSPRQEPDIRFGISHGFTVKEEEDTDRRRLTAGLLLPAFDEYW